TSKAVTFAQGSSGRSLSEVLKNLITGNFSGVGIPSILAEGGTAVDVDITNTATTTVADGVQLTAGDQLSVTADAEIIIDADSKMTAKGLVATSAMAAIDVDVDSDALVSIGGATLSGYTVNIAAHNRMDVNAYSDALTKADLAGSPTFDSRGYTRDFVCSG
ncbi:MAG: hypothetical protein V3S17_06980, partial [candidate division Zixibacteria bacterium]